MASLRSARLWPQSWNPPRSPAWSTLAASPARPVASTSRSPVAALPRRLASSSTSASSSQGRSSGFITALACGVFGSTAYLFGALYPPAAVTMVNPRPAAASPHADSDEGKEHVARIEAQLLDLPQVRKLMTSSTPGDRSDPNVEARQADASPSASNPSTQVPSLETSPGHRPHYIASRPYRNYPPSKLLHSLTAGTLRGPGKFAVPPLVLAKTEAGAAAEGGSVGDCFIFIHVGRSLCGHDGITHGGLLATVCDEALARTAFVSLPAKVGVTARLELDYKAPTMADQFIVVETKLDEAKGRKAVVRGTIRDCASNKPLVEARAVFVQPKFAQLLDTSLVKSAMDSDLS